MYKNNKLKCLTGIFLLITSYLFAQTNVAVKDYSTVIAGSQQMDILLPMLKNKRVAILTNITGVVGKTTIVDTLLKHKVNIKKIFGPEHGFRSNTEAGEQVKNNKDPRTGLQVISLYGKNKKPTAEQLKNIDVVVYDIQDIGTRFYTYISTMSYAMEACAESKKEFIVLDRPNPNGFYIDGPLLQKELQSFLGLHPVPLVYGMTCGEYAQMVNNEGWLKNKIKCKLSVIKLKNYDRNASYNLPVKPSPNIPNALAVLLYPSLGLFEGTIVSLGRGTEFPFQVAGHPAYKDTSFCFIPLPSEVSKEPRYVNQKCFGLELRKDNYLSMHPRQLHLGWLKTMYNGIGDPGFFEANFNYHAGNKILQEQIKAGLAEDSIRKSWQADLDNFKLTRKKYLLYEDIK